MGLPVYSLRLLVAAVCLVYPPSAPSVRISNGIRDVGCLSSGFISAASAWKRSPLSPQELHYASRGRLQVPISHACQSISQRLDSSFEPAPGKSDSVIASPGDYAGVKFLAGIEAHIQLALPRKIFCDCVSTASFLSEDAIGDFGATVPSCKSSSDSSSCHPRCVDLYNRLHNILSYACKGHFLDRRRSLFSIFEEDAISFEDYGGMYNSDVGHFRNTHWESVASPVSDMSTIHRLNEFVCPVCKGEPGALPLLSPLAVLYGVSACQAFACEVSRSVSFERKVYSYADLPKRYQLTQVSNPIGMNGRLILKSGRCIRVQRVNLEEDTARNLSVDGLEPSLDYNRSGIGLIEVVTEACEFTVSELVECCSVMSRLAVGSGLCKGLMHEGNIRFDINLSVPSMGSKRIEIKNLNSFRRIRKAVLQCLSSGCRGSEPVPSPSLTSPANLESGDTSLSNNMWRDLLPDVFDERSASSDMSSSGRTLGWRSSKGVEYMRDKSSRSCYLNLADTNIPTIFLSEEIIAAVKSVALAEDRPSLESVSTKYPEVPVDLLRVIQKGNDSLDLFVRLSNDVGDPVFVAKWLVNSILPVVRVGSVDVEQLCELLKAVKDKRMNVDTAKRILPDFTSGGMRLAEYMRHHNLELLGESATRAFVDRYLAANPVHVPSRGLSRVEVTRLVGDIVASSGQRLHYSLVRDYLVERTGAAE